MVVARWLSKPLVAILALALLATATLVFELHGGRTSVFIKLSGDVARESRWVGQYGQLTCVAACAACVWLLEEKGRRRKIVGLMIIACLTTTLAAAAGKKLTGRVRPRFEHAGQFLGPEAERDASNESFPSAHTASAFALRAILATSYPRGRALWWTLAAGCGILRWIRDSHWLSDVLAGAALGLAIAYCTLWLADRLSVDQPMPIPLAEGGHA
jgi:undecaprenyl-diphosphatase